MIRLVRSVSASRASLLVGSLALVFATAVAWGAARTSRDGQGPMIRVGVAVGATGPLSLASTTGLRVLDAQTDSLLLESIGSAVLEVARVGSGVRVAPTAGPVITFVNVVRIEPSGTDPVMLDGVPYRGAIEVFAVEDSAMNAVNELLLEEYLLGVVPIEIGPRGEEEFAAVAAQAVAARTYAVAHLRAREEMGFDVFGSVEDQAYGGMAAERPESTRAVNETKGRILMYDGLPIRAMYHSTCGGRTSPVEEVLDRASAPYLQSVSDRAPDGTDYCAASPRYRWVDTLQTVDLNGRVRREMERIFGASVAQIGDVVGLRIAERTPSGRVRALAIRGTNSEFVVERLDIRIALQDDEGRILGSTDFDIVTRDDGTIELHGRGYGHGSGMCQWGAIGRARAGQKWETILATYYPGTELVSAY